MTKWPIKITKLRTFAAVTLLAFCFLELPTAYSSNLGDCLLKSAQEQLRSKALNADYVTKEALQVAKILRENPAVRETQQFELFAEQIPLIQSMLERALGNESGQTLQSRYGQKVLRELIAQGANLLDRQQVTYHRFLDYAESGILAIQASQDQSWSLKQALRSSVPFSKKSALKEFIKTPFSRDPTVQRAHRVGGVVIPTVAALDIEHLNATWGENVFFIGLTDHSLEVDGVPKSPWEFFRHDMNHLVITLFSLENMNPAARARWSEINQRIQHELIETQGKPGYWPLRAALFIAEHELGLQKNLVEDHLPESQATRDLIVSRMAFRYKISKIPERVSANNDLQDLLPPGLRVHSTEEQRAAFLNETIEALARVVSEVSQPKN